MEVEGEWGGWGVRVEVEGELCTYRMYRSVYLQCGDTYIRTYLFT